MAERQPRVGGDAVTRVMAEPQADSDTQSQIPISSAGVTEVTAVTLELGTGSTEPRSTVLRAEPTTELGFSELLAERLAPSARFVVEPRAWYVYEGGRWQPDRRGRLEDATKGVAKEVYESARRKVEDPTARARLRNRLLSRGFMRAAISLAASDRRVAALTTDFDSAPDLLNVANGTIHLATGLLTDHQPGDLLTQMTPVEFAANAASPVWDAFLRRSLGQDETLVDYLRRAVGLTLAADMSVPALFLVHGPTASGKSTFLEVLARALGDYAIATNAQEVLLRRRSERATEPHLVKLRGARLVIASETPAHAVLDEARVKAMTGGDTISARSIFQQPIEFRPQFHIWLATNHLPRIEEVDDSIYRRIKVIPFAHSVARDDQDPDLRRRLLAEMPGILAWAVRGAGEARVHGLGVHPTVEKATSRYRGDMDVIGAFLSERFVPDPNGQIWSGALYSEYSAWCLATGEERVPQGKLAPLLRERGMASRRSTGGRRLWTGFCARPSEANRAA
jgi:putative DNA primase/helicase